MLRLTLNHERLEIPHTNYVAQCNMVPNNCKYVHAYQDMIPLKLTDQVLATVSCKFALPHLLQFKTENNLSSIKSNTHMRKFL